MLTSGKSRKVSSATLPFTARKVSVFGVILVRIFGEIQSISWYSVRMRENADQNDSEYGHFLRSVYYKSTFRKCDDICQNVVISKDEKYFQFKKNFFLQK